MLAMLLHRVERLAVVLAGVGAVIIVVQMLWISYGVFMRYVLSSPDGTVTEATALLLFPAAFLGLAYALKEDAYPKVSFLPDALSPRGRRWLEALNLVLMIVVGGFFSIAAVDATWLSFSVPTRAAAWRTDVHAVRSENPTELTRRNSRADSAGSLSSTLTTSSIWQLGS